MQHTPQAYVPLQTHATITIMDINPQTVGNEGQGENYKFGKMWWKCGTKIHQLSPPKETLHWQPTQEIFTHKKLWFGVRHCVLQPSPLNTCWGRQNGPFRRACLLARSHRVVAAQNIWKICSFQGGHDGWLLQVLQLLRLALWLVEIRFAHPNAWPLAMRDQDRGWESQSLSKWISTQLPQGSKRSMETSVNICQLLGIQGFSPHKKPLRGRKKKANKGHCKAHGCHGPVLTGIKGLWWLVWCNGLIQLICVLSWQDSTV